MRSLEKQRAIFSTNPCDGSSRTSAIHSSLTMRDIAGQINQSGQDEQSVRADTNMSQLLEVMETWSIGEVADLAPNVIRAIVDGGVSTPQIPATPFCPSMLATGLKLSQSRIRPRSSTDNRLKQEKGSPLLLLFDGFSGGHQGVLSGSSVGSQWVLRGSSAGPQWVFMGIHGYSWVLRLCIFGFSGSSQAGTFPRALGSQS